MNRNRELADNCREKIYICVYTYIYVCIKKKKEKIQVLTEFNDFWIFPIANRTIGESIRNVDT